MNWYLFGITNICSCLYKFGQKIGIVWFFFVTWDSLKLVLCYSRLPLPGGFGFWNQNMWSLSWGWEPHDIMHFGRHVQWSPGCSGLMMIQRLGERLETVAQPLQVLDGIASSALACWASHRLSFQSFLRTLVCWTETTSIVSAEPRHHAIQRPRSWLWFC